MAKMPEMNADFARWYAEAFMDEGQTRTNRWKGVVETAQAAEFKMVEVLVRYAFTTVAPADGGKNKELAESHQKLLSTISGSSVPMDPTTSRRELQILSAAVLVRLFSTLPDAAIAVLSASFERKRTAELPMDLAGIAKRALSEFSMKKHERPQEKAFEQTLPKIDFEVSQEALANMSAPQWKGELDRLKDATLSLARVIAEGQNRVTRLLLRRISLGEEELQMLWWLIGAYSNTEDKSFAEVDTALKPLAFAAELAELTEVSPGPASVKALLSRAGIVTEELKISDVINSANVDWIKTITESQRISPVTTPLHFALEKRIEINSDTAWLPVWSAMTGLPEEASMSGVKIAELFYLERLFLYVS